MDSEETYWLQIGTGEHRYTIEVPREAFMAMERECGFQGVPGELATSGFAVLADPSKGTLFTQGWIEHKNVVMTPEVPGD